MEKICWLVPRAWLVSVALLLVNGSLFAQAGGEDQASATLIPALPFQGQGNNANAVDDYAETCPDFPNGGNGRDHVYRYNNGPNPRFIDVSLCIAFSDYDTQLYIYEDTCVSGTALACQEDGCAAPGYANLYQSAISGFLLQPNKTYYFVVDGYDGNGGNYQINIDTIPPPAPPAITFSDSSNQLTTAMTYSGVPMAIVDMNGDWRDDIVRLDDRKELIVNYQNSAGGFTEIAHGQLGSGNHWSLCVADVDENGYNDILAGGAYNGLYLATANGSGSAFAITQLGGPNIFLQGSNFADIDNNGAVDIFACHDDGDNNKYRGDNSGTFSYDNSLLNTTTVPSSDNSGNYASIWTDYDHDGDLDMYLSKCRQGVSDPADPRRINMLFQNDGYNNFTEVAALANLKDSSQSWLTDFGDYDNDGDLDAIIINHDFDSRLMENNGDGTFSDVSATAGLANAIDFTGVQAFFRDFDNDGWLDLLVVGASHKLFVNNGDKTFSEDANGFFFGTEFMESCVIGDLNHDGFLDVYAGYANLYNSPSSTPDRLWINNGTPGNNYFAVNPVGTVSHINGIGAWIEIYGPWGKMVREVRSGEGYGVMNSFSQHFGIGTAAAIDSAYIFWPSGIVDRVVSPPINAYLTVVEGQSPAQKVIVNADSTVSIGNTAADMWGSVQIQDSATTRISVKYWPVGGAVDSVFIADYAFNNNLAKFNFDEFPTNLLPGTAYRWTVHAVYDINGQFGAPVDCFSDTLSFTTTGLVAVSPARPDLGVHIAPNPFEEWTTLEIRGYNFSAEGDLQLEVFELRGQRVRTRSGIRASKITLNRDGLADGVYLYRLRNASGSIEISGRLLLH
ncbi:MAG: FG-GAP-like repeat-containing protein [Bacteroidota bacterium]